MRKLLFIYLPVIVFGQTKYTAPLDGYVQALVKFKDFSGVVLVTKNDTVCLRKAYGYADRELKIPNEIDTKFRIASVTKQFTAAAIFILEQQGKLSLDDKLIKYIPDFPNGNDMTLRLLLNNRSGIDDYVEDKDIYQESSTEYTKEIMLEKIKKKKLLFAPGTSYEYSNSNYYLLGVIIEKITGKTYEEFVQQNIFNPLNMVDSGIDKNGLTLPNKAKGYEPNKTEMRNAGFIKLEAAYSAGSIYSTVDDIYKWSQCLKTNSILSETSKLKMFTPYSFGNNNEHYGYGAIIDSFLLRKKIWHSGGINGFTSYFVRYPKENITIIILSNVNSKIDNGNTSDCFSAILFDMLVVNPYNHIEVKQSTESLTKYTGNYISEGNYSISEKIEVILKGNKLYRKKLNAKDVELKPEGNGKFFYADGSDKQIEFMEDVNGHFVSIDFIFRGIKFNTWKRIQ